MAAPSIMLDDPAAFTNLLARWAVPDAVQVKLRDAGYSTVALLAHALPSLEDLQAFLESLLGRAPGSDPLIPIFSPEAAALRRAADVATLVADFGRKYPSELLRPEVMPSITFLGLVKEAVDNKRGLVGVLAVAHE
eukprot:s6644_g4.t1